MITTGKREQFCAFLPIVAGVGALVFGAGCNKNDTKMQPGECDHAEESPCEEGFVCREQPEGPALCQIAPGQPCDSVGNESNCAFGSTCVEDPGAEGGLVCLVDKASDCDPLEPFCQEDLTCAEVQEGGWRCFAPVRIEGTVTDAATKAPIAGAHVIGLNEEAVAVTDIAVSEADGSYVLDLPAVRNAEGQPIEANYSLRASAQDYQTFPGGLRTALPINALDAIHHQGGNGEETDAGSALPEIWIIDNALTQITLIGLPGDSASRFKMSGKLDHGSGEGDLSLNAAISGVLVVAEDQGEAFSAVSDRGGNFTIFNLPNGAYSLTGYAAKVDSETVTVSVAGADAEGIVLPVTIGPLATVSGNVQIVNAFGGAVTSVILVVESTFDELFARGETPRGLRAPQSGPPNVSGEFTIADVPDGRYVVLAAFENDLLVRDPDTGISGTDIVHIEVAGEDVVITDGFKITEALAVLSPGAEKAEKVSAAPTLRWADDSGEEWYEVRVYNALGEEVWNNLGVDSVSGSDEVSVTYGGPLEVGMYYQFRVTSWAQSGNKDPAPKSATEDLLGVFFYRP